MLPLAQAKDLRFRSNLTIAQRGMIAQAGAEAVIHSTRSRKTPIPHDPALYRLRNRIERCLNKLKRSGHSQPATTASQTSSLHPPRRFHNLDAMNINSPSRVEELLCRVRTAGVCVCVCVCVCWVNGVHSSEQSRIRNSCCVG